MSWLDAVTESGSSSRSGAQPDGIPAAVVEYDARWPALFQQIASSARGALDADVLIEHVGSTSVPGLPAKPIIDLLVVVDTMEQVSPTADALDWHGWRHQGDGGLEGRECCAARADLPYHHLYVVVRGNRQHLLPTRFRDVLRQDDRACAE